MQAIIPAFLLFLLFLFLYGCYKVIWYTILLLRFRKRLRRCGVRFVRPFWKIVFGEKGATDFTFVKDGETYAVSVLSFISNHSRWNIEQARTHYYLEVRRYNHLFYDRYVNSGTEPEHSKEYRRESRLCFTRLALSPAAEGEKKILLVHPRPKQLTYATWGLDYLREGSEVAGYKILFAGSFFEFLNGSAGKGTLS